MVYKQFQYSVDLTSWRGHSKCVMEKVYASLQYNTSNRFVNYRERVDWHFSTNDPIKMFQCLTLAFIIITQYTVLISKIAFAVKDSKLVHYAKMLMNMLPLCYPCETYRVTYSGGDNARSKLSAVSLIRVRSAYNRDNLVLKLQAYSLVQK